MDVIGQLGFGYDFGYLEGNGESIKEVMAILTTEPRLRELNPFRRLYNKNFDREMDKLTKTTLEAIRRGRDNAANNTEEGKNIVSLLLKGNEGKMLTDEDLLQEALTLLQVLPFRSID
jgi:cytochrome P450